MKNIKFLIVLFFVTLLSGCVFNEPKYINLKSKPNLYYYSNEVYEKLKSNQDYSLKVFDVNYYEYHDVSKEDLDILPSFLKSLNSNNYVISLNLDDLKANDGYDLEYQLYIANHCDVRVHISAIDGRIFIEERDEDNNMTEYSLFELSQRNKY